MTKTNLGCLKGSILYTLLLLSASQSDAATIAWDGPTTGSASWGNAVNWQGDVLPGAADIASLSTANTTLTISLDASRTIGQLYFNNGSTAYTVGSAADKTSGYSLTLNHVKRDTNATGQQIIAANVNLAVTNSIWDINSGNNNLFVTGSIAGAGQNLLKYGSGTLMLAGANTYSGSTFLRAGTITLNFNDAGAPASNILSSTSTLTGGGGTLTFTGKNGNSVSQTFASTHLEGNTTSLSISNGATANTRTVVNLGAITHATGATISLAQPTGTGNTTIGANNGYTTSTSNDASGILGGWATVTSAASVQDWAVNDGTNIVAYTGYTDLAGATPVLVDSSTSNVRITNGSTGNIGQNSGVTTINTLRYADAAARLITVGAGNTLRLGTSGGILSTGAGGLTIGEAGNAGTLTAGSADDTAAEVVLNNSATSAVTINSVITNNGTGAVAFTKTGAGAATLTAISTYTGGTFVNAGTLTLAAGTDRLAPSGNLTINGGTLNLGSSTQNLSGNFLITGGTLSTGTIIKSGNDYEVQAGTISAILGGSSIGLVKTGAGTATLGGNNTYTGTTTVLEGRLNATAGGSIDGNIVIGSIGGGNEAVLAVSDSVGATSGSNTSVTVYQNGVFSLGNGNNILNLNIVGGRATSNFGYANGTITMTGGALQGATGIFGTFAAINTNASATTATISAPLSGSSGTKTFTVADGAATIDLAVTSSIATASSIAKSGPGVMALVGVKGYSGTTTINGGTLEVDTLANGGTNSSLGSSSAAAGNLLLRDGSTLRFTGAAQSTDRLFTVGQNGAGHAATLEASGSGAVTFTGTGNIAWGTNGQTRTLRLGGTNTGNNTLAASINNNGAGLVSLEKNGAGRWVLTGTNAYTGTTTVNAGTLMLNGSLGNTAVTVNGGTLGGTGSLLGSVTVNAGGTLAPGASIESLDTGALSLASGSTLSIEIDTAAETADLLNVTGAFGIDSGAILALSDLGGNQTLALGTEFTLINYSGLWNGGLFTYNSTTLGDDTVLALGSNYFLANYNDGGAFTLTVTSVPEPSAPFLIAVSLVAGALLRQRRNRGSIV